MWPKFGAKKARAVFENARPHTSPERAPHVQPTWSSTGVAPHTQRGYIITNARSRYLRYVATSDDKLSTGWISEVSPFPFSVKGERGDGAPQDTTDRADRGDGTPQGTTTRDDDYPRKTTSGIQDTEGKAENFLKDICHVCQLSFPDLLKGGTAHCTKTEQDDRPLSLHRF